MRGGLCWFWCVAALPVLAGCSSSPGLATVDCRLTKDGRPIPRAELRFDASGIQSISVVAVSLHDGSFYLDLGEREGFPAGDYSIVATVYETEDGGPLPGGEEGEALRVDGKTVRRQFLFQKTLFIGPNSLDLKIEEGEEVVEPEEEDPGLDPTLDTTTETTEWTAPQRLDGTACQDQFA